MLTTRKTTAAVQTRAKKKDAAPKRGIHAVAELAGVSIATVSRVVNGTQNVDPGMSRRVWKAVAEAEYAPNRHAQALISGRTRLLGLLVAEIVNPFFPELIQGFEQAAMKEGFSILIGSTNGDPQRAADWVQRMLQHGIEGLALLTFTTEPPQIFEYLKKTPTVEAGIGLDRRGTTEVVDVNYMTGIRQAVQHLAVLGHRDIVFAAGAPDDPTAVLRESCFRTCMREVGFVTAKDSICVASHTLEGGMAAAERILRRRTLPTALICSNDLMAIGALKVFYGASLAVPRDLSLIGLDDIHLAQFTTPPLTTVRIPRGQLAEVCFDVLFRRLKRNEAQMLPRREVQTDLVVRQSTGFPRHAPDAVKKLASAKSADGASAKTRGKGGKKSRRASS